MKRTGTASWLTATPPRKATSPCIGSPTDTGQKPVDLESISVVEAGEKPGQLVVVGPRQEGKPRALQFQDAVTGQLGEVAFAGQSL